jgi:hypothetical protein
VLYEWVNRAIFCLANCAESRLFRSNPSENCHNSWKVLVLYRKRE